MNELRHIFQRDIEPCDKYLTDESRMSGGTASKVFFPKNALEISEILKYCTENRIAVTVYARGTGITGASVPNGGVVLSLEKLSWIGDLSEKEGVNGSTLVAGSYATLDDILEKLRGTKWFYPVDPTEMSASIGGTVATNASGALSFKYGPTRKWISAIEVVLMDGSIQRIARGENFADDSGFLSFPAGKIRIPDYKMPECKNAAGLYSAENMDAIDLFIGSEGLLGVITEVEIDLIEKQSSLSIVKFFESDDKAVSFVQLLKKLNDERPEFIEYFNDSGLEMLKNKIHSDPLSLPIPEIDENAKAAIFFELKYNGNEIGETLTRIVKAGDNWDKSWCSWENIEKERIKTFRHALPEAVNTYIAEVKKEHPQIHKLGTDFAVSDSNFLELLAFYRDILNKSGLRSVAFGHIGDNHIHINLLPSNPQELEKGKEIYALMAGRVVELKGSVSAEHGIGKLKHRYLEMAYGTAGIDEMRRVKRFFDPHFLLNRNNMFSAEEK